MDQILYYNSLCDYFAGAQGLRQGDPLSPYLFIIVINILSAMLDSTGPNFKHHWRCKQINITHVFFADDILLFSYGDRDSISRIMQTLQRFSCMSGLKPNVLKSHSFLPNCNFDVVDWFNQTYGISNGNLHVKFLGVLLISSKLSVNDCTPLIHKIIKRVTGLLFSSLLLEKLN